MKKNVFLVIIGILIGPEVLTTEHRIKLSTMLFTFRIIQSAAIAFQNVPRRRLKSISV